MTIFTTLSALPFEVRRYHDLPPGVDLETLNSLIKEGSIIAVRTGPFRTRYSISTKKVMCYEKIDVGAV
jgi:hypothetical protein